MTGTRPIRQNPGSYMGNRFTGEGAGSGPQLVVFEPGAEIVARAPQGARLLRSVGNCSQNGAISVRTS